MEPFSGGISKTTLLNAKLSALDGRVETLTKEIEASKARESELQERLAWMRDIGSALARRNDPADALGVLLDRASKVVGSEFGVVYLVETGTNYICARTVFGGRLREIRLRLGEGLAGACAASRRTINVKDARKDARWSYALDEITGEPSKGVLCVPILDGAGELLGVIQVANKINGEYFTENDELVLLSVAVNISILLENFRYYIEEASRNIELNEIRESLEERVKELDMLFVLQRTMNDAISEIATVEAVADAIFSVLRCDSTLICFGNDANRRHVYVHAKKRVPIELKSPTAWFSTLLGSKRPMLLDDVLVPDPSGNPDSQLEIGAYIGVPLRDNERVLGTIEIFNSALPREPYTEDQARLLALLGGQLARALARHQVRQQQESAERIHALGSMLSGILHDLKTPIAICSGYVRLMERSEDRATREDFSRIIHKQIDDIRAMTREIIAYARGESDVYERVCDLTVLAEELERSLQTSLVDSEVSASVVSGVRGRIRLDEGKLKRVLFNLARNAFEAMDGGGGHIQLLFERGSDGRLEISVEDNGPGIPLEIRDRMFDVFVSSGKSTGSGLGLSIVKRLVEQLQGEIRFTTSKLGTTFVVSLPWNDADA